MEPFAPEFAQYWLPDRDARVGHADDDAGEAARAEEKALEELADRVSAARCII
jgi:hypothetical protein